MKRSDRKRKEKKMQTYSTVNTIRKMRLSAAKKKYRDNEEGRKTKKNEEEK